MRKNNFIKYILYVSATTFATQMSLPYFSVWMLEGMKLNYIWYSSIHIISVISGLIAFPIWGKVSDHYGNAQILKRTSVLIAIIPLLWIVARHPVLLLIVEFYSGFVCSAFALCSTNYIYDSCSREMRINCHVFFNLFNGLSAFAGATLGGILAEKLPPFFGYPILSVFLLSGTLRLLSDFLIAGHFEEVRKVKKMSNRDLFLSVVGIHPLTDRMEDWGMTNST